MTVREEPTLLDRAQHEIFMHLLPVILCMAVVGIVGIIGNILTIIFYASKPRRCPSTIQITCLATADLLVCLMIIPNIIEMVVNMKYNHSIPCKLTHFFGLWTIACSCFILWLIALDRYRKICKPFAKQMTVKFTRCSIVAIVIVSFFISVRNFVNFTNTEVHVNVSKTNETVSGRYCTTRDDPGYKISVSIFHFIDFLFVIVCLVTVIVTYSCIICSLIKLKNKKKQSASHAKVGTSPTGNTSTKEVSEVSCGVYDSKGLSYVSESVAYGLTHLQTSADFTTDFHSQNAPTITDAGVISNDSLRRTVTKMNAKKRKRKRRRKIAARSASERNLTFMMLTVSLLFVLCFIPFFVIKIIMRLVLKSGVEFELTVGIQFALKLVYVNSVSNPIVYCFFNPQFRKYIKGILLKCMRCHVKSYPSN